MIQREEGLKKSTAILTSGGGTFDYLEPRQEDVKIADIFESLSKTCRFRGMCPGFYSVAEHSVMVSQIARVLWVEARGEPVPSALVWAALMHDAAEAYTGDLPSPIKRALGAVWEVLEQRIEHTTHLAMNAPGTEHPIVKASDVIAYGIERRHIYGWDDVELTVTLKQAITDMRIRAPEGVQPWKAADMMKRAALALPEGAAVCRAQGVR